MKHLPKLLAQTIAAAVIAVFWCISAVGTTVGTAVGVTTLATAKSEQTLRLKPDGVGVVVVGEGGYGRGYGRRGYYGYGGYPYYGYGYPYRRRGWVVWDPNVRNRSLWDLFESLPASREVATWMPLLRRYPSLARRNFTGPVSQAWRAAKADGLRL